jgi:hypothetical protein
LLPELAICGLYSVSELLPIIIGPLNEGALLELLSKYISPFAEQTMESLFSDYRSYNIPPEGVT